MKIINLLRRKRIYILPSANASMVSRYADGFRAGREQGYTAGLDAAREAVDANCGWRPIGRCSECTHALAAIDALKEK